MSTKSGKVGLLAGLLALLSSGVVDKNISKGIEVNRKFQGMRRGQKGDSQTPAGIIKHRKVKRRMANKSRRINFAKAKH